jgi:PqqD family protein of HPr-rel-A system
MTTASDPAGIARSARVVPGLTRPVRWRIVAPHAIAWREWNDEVVVRAQTGSVHLLNALAGRVLRTLLDSRDSLSPSDVSAAVQMAAPDDEPDAVRSAVDQTLEEFQRLGIIEPGPP